MKMQNLPLLYPSGVRPPRITKKHTINKGLLNCVAIDRQGDLCGLGEHYLQHTCFNWSWKPRARAVLCLMHLNLEDEFKVGKDPYSIYQTTHQRVWIMRRASHFGLLREKYTSSITEGTFLKRLNPNQYIDVDWHYWQSLPDGTTTQDPAPNEFKPWAGKWTYGKLSWSYLWVVHRMRLQKNGPQVHPALRMKTIFQFQFRPTKEIAVKTGWGKKVELPLAKLGWMFDTRLNASCGSIGKCGYVFWSDLF